MLSFLSVFWFLKPVKLKTVVIIMFVYFMIQNTRVREELQVKHNAPPEGEQFMTSKTSPAMMLKDQFITLSALMLLANIQDPRTNSTSNLLEDLVRTNDNMYLDKGS